MQFSKNFVFMRIIILCFSICLLFSCVSESDYDIIGILEIFPRFHDFSNVNVSDSAQIDFVITNKGKAGVYVLAIGLVKKGGSAAFPGSDELAFDDFAIKQVLDNSYKTPKEVSLPLTGCFKLKGGKSITVSVEFAPTNLDAAFACLELSCAAEISKTVLIELMCNTGEASIKVTPASYDFEEHSVNASSDAQTFTIENIGSANLTVTNVALTDGDVSEFSIDDAALLSTIVPGGTTSFDVTFNPSDVGNKRAIITISNSDINLSEYKFTVLGIGSKKPPIITNAQATPEAVIANGMDKVLFSAHVIDPTGKHDLQSVNVDLSDIDGNVAQQLYDDGTNGDYVADDDIYSFVYTMPNNPTLYGIYEIEFSAEDKGGNTASSKAYLAVATGKVIHVSASRGADDDKGYWRYKSPVPTASHWSSCVLKDNRIYVIGGSYDSRTYYTKNEVYNPLTDTWETKKNMSIGRNVFGIGVINDKIYAICGLNNGNLDSIEEYSIQTNTWSNLTNANNTKSNFSHIQYNNELYLFTGYNPNNYSTKVEKYNPLTQTWTNLASLNKGVQHSAAALFNGKVYVTGGFNTSNFDTLSIYNIQQDTWDYSKSSMQNTRQSHVMVALDGKIYAIAGAIGGNVSKTVEVYDPVLDTWSYVSSLNEIRATHCGIVCNERIYVFSGSQLSYPVNTVEEFTPKGDGTEQWPFRTIQRGIEEASASDGDLVWVHDDVYKGDGNRDLDFGSKKIIVYGNPANPNVVTIDCEGTSNDPHRGFKFDSGETNDSILTGFTIQNGYVKQTSSGGANGAGILLD
ncbi:MAG: choice-of-anchor D domain-containing protein, partial [Planctomycetes bacterium]|nr:choice-of-anchor D domain-containing protein [Planctomycetota bacterium]